MAQEPDSALVEAAAKGDGDSFTELCRRYYPAMVAIAHSMLGDRHLAEDLFSGEDFEYKKTEAGFVLRCRAKDLDKDEIHQYEFKVRK